MDSDVDESIEMQDQISEDAHSGDTDICPFLVRDPSIIHIDELGDRILVVGTSGCEIMGGRHKHDEAMCFRVCSRTLARWSRVMKAMLFGNFRESTQDVVDFPDDHPEIMKVLLEIAHGDFKAVFELDKRHADPLVRYFLADDVYSIIALANKYFMTRALSPWASKIIPSLMPYEAQSEEYCSIDDFRRLEKALFIACEFGHFQLFEGASTRLVWLLKRDQELFSSCIEPFPACIDSASPSSPSQTSGTIGHIRHIRLELIESILSPLRRLISALTEGDDPTGSYTCNAESKNTRDQCRVSTLGVLWLFLGRESLNPLPDAADVVECPRDLHTRLVLHTMFPDRGLWSDAPQLHRHCRIRENVTAQLLSAPKKDSRFYLPPETMKKTMLARAEDFHFPRPE